MSGRNDVYEELAGVFEPDINMEKAKNTKKTTLRLIRCLFRQKWKLLLVIISILAGSLFEILSPRVLGIAINEIYEGVKNTAAAAGPFRVSFETLGMVLFTLLGLYLLQSVFSFIRQMTMTTVSQKLTLSLRKEISEKLTRLPLRYFDSHQKGDILSRITNDIEKLADTLEESLTQLISSVIGIAGALIMMVMISPLLTLISLAAIGLSMGIACIIASKTEQSFADNQEILGKLNAGIEDAFSGNLVVKAFGLEDKMAAENERLNSALYRTGTKAAFLSYVVNPMVRMVNHIGYVLVAVKGVIQVMNGTISVGDIQAFIQYVNQVSEPVTDISWTINKLQGAIAAAERVFELLDEEEEDPDPAVPKLPDHPMGNIRFEHIRFGYSEDNIFMDDVSVDIKAGSKVAVVGPSGAGKTTLVNLLMRFYDLLGGRITLDGVDIVEMGRGELRALTAMVLQESWLFGGTIKENIAYGHEGASDDAVFAAAKAACADPFIRTLPCGYDTVLSEELNSLSQGQRQIITIARAILADPMILILDEATSSVDTGTELEIQKAMDTLMEGRTSFVIAHRLSTIRNADCILVMNKGSVIEQGTHEELMRKNGFYADLYNSQFVMNPAV
ncbi:MAG: ABC transporter ATP-binding protein/permease [Oscillospiraceae bacterium]|nr:ABC transporter ATP-binding protein/permease [Oscillospiraceae bacterium]